MARKGREQITKDYIVFPVLSALAATAAEVAVEVVKENRRSKVGGALSRLRRRKVRSEGLVGTVTRVLEGGAFQRTFKSHAEGRRDRQRRPQRVGLRDHLLRPLPRPDLHVQQGGDRGRVARRLLRAPAARRGEHRGQPDVPRAQRQPRLPGGAPPLPGHAEHPLRGDRAAGEGAVRALRAGLQHRPVPQAARHGAAHDPAPGVPRRPAAPQARPLPRRGRRGHRQRQRQAHRLGRRQRLGPRAAVATACGCRCPTTRTESWLRRATRDGRPEAAVSHCAGL